LTQASCNQTRGHCELTPKKKASRSSKKNIRRNSASSVSFGGKVFPPKLAEATEMRQKKHWQDDLSAESFQIILPSNHSVKNFHSRHCWIILCVVL